MAIKIDLRESNSSIVAKLIEKKLKLNKTDTKQKLRFAHYTNPVQIELKLEELAEFCKEHKESGGTFILEIT